MVSPLGSFQSSFRVCSHGRTTSRGDGEIVNPLFANPVRSLDQFASRFDAVLNDDDHSSVELALRFVDAGKALAFGGCDVLNGYLGSVRLENRVLVGVFASGKQVAENEKVGDFLPRQVCRKNCGKYLDPPNRNQNAQYTSSGGKHKRFSDELPNETPAAGSEGRTNRQFFASAGRARQQQSSDIRAGNEQEQAYGSEERQESCTHISNHGVSERRNGGICKVNFFSVLVSDSPSDRIEIGAGLFHCYAIAKAAET